MKVKIGVKITVGFVVMLALIGILGVVSFLSLAKSGHNLDSIQTSSQRLILAMQIQNSLLREQPVQPALLPTVIRRIISRWKKH